MQWRILLTNISCHSNSLSDSLISLPSSFSSPVCQSILQQMGMRSITCTQEGPIWTKGKQLWLLSQLLIATQIGNISWAPLEERPIPVSHLVQIEVPASALFTTSLNFLSVNCLMKFQLFLYRIGFDKHSLQSIILTGKPPAYNSNLVQCLWMTSPF